ncbi:MAG: NUDIX hydrolase [Candidatus Methylomirabilales bacterium]
MIIDEVRRILGRHTPRRLRQGDRSRAAVLVPLFLAEGNPRILLVKRTDRVPTHQGQIAFPGGRWQEEDQDIVETALREAEEEIGLQRKDVRILGELDDATTRISNFLVSAVVGAIPHPYPFRLDPAEISELFSVPLDLLRDPEAFRQEERIEGGRTVRALMRREGDHVIWGVTARILDHLGHLLFRAPLQEKAGQRHPPPGRTT